MRTTVASTGVTASASLLCMGDPFCIVPFLDAAAALANPRQLLADQHVDDAATAKHGAHGDAPGFTLMDSPDNAGAFAKPMRPHRRERRTGLFGGNDRDDLAFVRKIKRIEPED